jgi:hypothetical protein
MKKLKDHVLLETLTLWFASFQHWKLWEHMGGKVFSDGIGRIQGILNFKL